MDPSGLIKQLNDLVNENTKLKKENEELKKNKTNEDLLKQIDDLKSQINKYEEQIKSLDINNVKDQLNNYINIIRIIKLKLLFIKNEYNKLSDCTNLLYTYYKTAKLLNPNLLEISKQINQDKLIPYIIRYNICINIVPRRNKNELVKYAGHSKWPSRHTFWCSGNYYISRTYIYIWFYRAYEEKDL